MLVADKPTLLRLVLLIDALSMEVLAFCAYFFPITSLYFLQVKKDYDDFLQIEKCLFLW